MTKGWFSISQHFSSIFFFCVCLNSILHWTVTDKSTGNGERELRWGTAAKVGRKLFQSGSGFIIIAVETDNIVSAQKRKKKTEKPTIFVRQSSLVQLVGDTYDERARTWTMFGHRKSIKLFRTLLLLLQSQIESTLSFAFDIELCVVCWATNLSAYACRFCDCDYPNCIHPSSWTVSVGKLWITFQATFYENA